MSNTLTVGSLFSGIGGLEYGLEMTGGFETKWQVEIDEYATKVLAKHWPDVTRLRDIRECGKHNLAPVDLICGGFPCQPHSLAGKRQASGDERDLWGEFYRIICELRPTWVVAENVPGLLSSEDGRFFGRILRDLAQAGYDAEWQTLRASDFGAPHQRERIFIVAYATSQQSRRLQQRGLQPNVGHDSENVADAAIIGQRTRRPELPGLGGSLQSDGHGASRDMADAAGQGLPLRGYAGLTTGDTQASAGLDTEPERCSELEYTDCSGQQKRYLATVTSESRFACGATHPATGTRQTQPRVCGSADGLSGRLDGHRWPARPGERQYAWEPPRVVAEKVIRRAQRLKALGNAVVPQVAEYIGHCILASMEVEVVA